MPVNRAENSSYLMPWDLHFDRENAADIGPLDKHGNPNVLTLDKGTSKLGQCCTAQSTLVQIERYEGEIPPITAFDEPATVE